MRMNDVLQNEPPQTVHGRLKEACHIAGYSMSRACDELEWLLEKDERWQALGFDDGATFIESVHGLFDEEMPVPVERRKRLAVLMTRVASQRSTAKVLGVSNETVRRDIGAVTNVTPPAEDGAENQASDGVLVTSVTPPEEAAPEAPVAIATGAIKGISGTGETEWYTPAEVLDAARDVLGMIDLDPASSDAAQAKVGAANYFTRETDGLAQEWHGRVWLNPPYAQPHIADFVSKLVEERLAGRVTAAILLTHNYTDTTWFHEAARVADAICFTKGRIRFYDKSGNIAAPAQGQAFFYYGDHLRDFAERFLSIGHTVTPLGRRL